MSGRDDRTYGFNRADAEALAKSIRSGDREYMEMRPRQNSMRLVRFELRQDFNTGAAVALIKNMAGEEIEESILYDPEGIFEELVDKDTGLALKQSGVYYAIQAPCGGNASSSSSV